MFEFGASALGNFAASMEIINYVWEIGKHFLDRDDPRINIENFQEELLSLKKICYTIKAR